MRDLSNDELGQALMSGQSQSTEGNHISAYAYIITKIFPLLATGIFASTTDVKKPESIALSAAMVSSTALPVLSDVLKLTGRFQLSLETLSAFFMFAGVGMMDQGAIAENNKSVRSIVSLTAVACFSLFAAINVVYNSLKLTGYISNRKPGMELVSSSFGFVGSLLFLAGNTLGYIAQKESGESIDVTSRMIAVASCFTISTALHALLAGHDICAKVPEEDVLTDLSVDDDVLRLEGEGRVVGINGDNDYLNSRGRNSPVPPEVVNNRPRCNSSAPVALKPALKS